MKLRKLFPAMLVGAGCVAIAGIPAGASGRTKHAKSHHARIQVESIQVGSKVGPLVVRVRGKSKAKLKLTIDGHRLPGAFEFDGRHTQVAEPRADVLRPGANKLRITGPGHAKATRTVQIPRRFLIVDAGADIGATVKDKTRLGTVPAVGGKAVDTAYDWSIVSGPTGQKGAKATLLGAEDPRPMLDPTADGTYVLQVEANPDGPAPPTFDQVQVAVSRSAPPIGVPINTSDVDKGGAIVIGNEVLGSSSSGLAYAILERKTGATVDSGSVGADSGGVARLQSLSDQYAGGDRFRFMMIVSGRVGGLPESALGAFSKFTMSVGGSLLTPEDFDLLKRGSGFTVLGIPGAAEGAAAVRIPGGTDRAPASGALTGYLEQNQAVDVRGSKLWEYVSPDHPSFDTRAPGSTATHNVMTVEGKDPITADLPAGVTAGLHVVVLESLTLRTVDNVILGTNGNTSSPSDRQRQDAAAGKLGEVTTRTGTALVLVQTVGRPKAAGPEWGRIVSSLGRLGANRQLVNALDGTTEYALVARAGSEVPPAESSTAYDHGSYRPPHLEPARLVGSLSRGRRNAFEPTVSSTPTTENPGGTVNLGLMKVAYQPTQAWPAFPGDAAKAKLAEQYICGKLGFCGSGASQCPTVRDCFWQDYDQDWAHVEDIIGRMAFPTGQTGFDEATFKGVHDQLEEEAGDVAIVQRYLAALRAPLERTSTRSYVDLQAIGKQIYDSVQRPAGNNSKAYILGLIGKVVAVGGFAGPPVSAAAAGLSASFGLASYLSTESGQPILGTEINVKAESVAQEIFNRVDTANRTSRGLGLLLVSDYGKLTAAAKNIRGDWKLDGDQTAIENQLRTGSKQWFYEALVPAGYPYLIRANASNARQLKCEFPDHRTAWPNQPDVDQMQATVGYDSNGNPIRAIFYFTFGYGGGSSPNATVGDSMFKPLDEGGLGIEKLDFFSPQVWGGGILHARNGYTKCELGFLPDRG